LPQEGFGSPASVKKEQGRLYTGQEKIIFFLGVQPGDKNFIDI
jgi:hypothetical protein